MEGFAHLPLSVFVNRFRFHILICRLRRIYIARVETAIEEIYFFELLEV